MAVGSTPGLDLNSMFNDGMNSISARGNKLQADMDALQKGGAASPEAMLNLQFEMGQYNALLESLSSVTKSLTDMLKSLSQRTG